MLTIGMPKEWVAYQLGHTSTKMIDQHYGKWISEDAPDMAKIASERMGFLKQNVPLVTQTIIKGTKSL